MVPSRREAARLLLGLEPPDWLVQHSVVVADIAAFLALRTARRGARAGVDRRLTETAALLHDLDKALPAGHPLRELGHGRGGARWLADHGHDELSPAVAHHPVTRLADDRHWASWSAASTAEERIVAYADKRATSRLVPMSTRFAEWRDRYPADRATTDLAQRRAAELERDVCAAAGIGPGEVGRLRWARAALDGARAGQP